MKDRELRDDPPASGAAGAARCRPSSPRSTRCARETTRRSRSCSRPCARPPATRCWSARSTCRQPGSGPYLEHLDLAFAFELLHSPWEAERAARGDRRGARRSRAIAWVLSNHDFPRLATRLGPDAVRAAAILLLTLPGPAFVYQGDEIGMADGGEAEPPGRPLRPRPPPHIRCSGTEPRRAASATGEPWLAPTDPAARNVADQRARPGLDPRLYRRADRAAARARRPGARCSTPARGCVAYRAATT